MGNLPYSLEQDLFDRKTRALALIDQGRAADPLSVSRMLSIAHVWPQIRPGVALSFAAAGFDASSPETKAAAQLATKQNMSEQAWATHFANQPDKTSASSADSADYSSKPWKAPGIADAFSTWEKKVGTSAARRLAVAAYDAQQTPGATRGDIKAALQDAMGTKAFKKQVAKFQSAQQDSGGGFFSDVLDALPGVGAVKGIIEGKPLSEIALRAVPGAKIAEDIDKAALDNASKAPVVGGGVKAVTREAATVANAGLQTVQGAIRNEAGGGTPLFSASGAPVANQTDLGQQLNALSQGKNADIGDGWLPDPNSAPAQAAHQAQLQAAPTIGGHAFTLGRASANLIFEPDTPAFNVLSGIVDAGVALKADPTAAVVGQIGDVRQSEKFFNPDTAATINNVSTSTGLLPTTSRVYLDQNTKAAWMASDDSTKTLQALSDVGQGSPSKLYRAINNSNLASPDFPITTVHGQPLVQQLADAKSVEEMKNVLAEATSVQRVPSAPGVTYHLKQGTDARIFANMPYGAFDPADKNTGWKVLDDVMRGGNVPVGVRDQVLDRYIRDPNPISGLNAASEAMTNHLVYRYGIDPEDTSAATSFFRDAHTTSRAYDIDQATGVERVRPGIGIAGQGFPVPAPSLESEGLNSLVSVPDQRTLRRMASDFNYITNTKPWKVTQTALAAPSMLWKPLQVLTARMMVRIFGETQLNMTGRGMINAFTHPINWLSTLIGTNYDKRWATFLDKIPGLDAKYLLNPEGMSILDDSDNLFMHSASFIHDPETIATKGYMVVPITHPDAGVGLAEQLGRMHADPIMRGVAQSTDPLAAKEWFWSGAGKDLRLARAPVVANEDAYNMQKLAAGKLSGYEPVGDIANDRAAADKYLDEVMYPRLVDMTGNGHPDLLEAVQTGKLKGRTIYNVSSGNTDLAVVDERASKYAKQLLDQGIGPQRGVPIREVLQRSASETSRAAAYGRQAIDWTFLHLVDTPDRVWNRQPALAQLKWTEAEELAPYLRPEDFDTFVKNAEKAQLPAEQLGRIRNITLDGTSTDRLTLPQLNRLAKANASDKLRNIVHDLTTRSQAFDSIRALVPFGDAFRLIAQRALKLAADEPQVVRRVQQGIQELRSPGSATINRMLGDPVNPDQGFFHTDPTTGEEVFTFPGSTILDQSLLGIPVPLQGQVSGLNMLGEGYPGLGGPMVTIPAKWFLPDTPTGNTIRDVIFPYGNSDSQGIGADIGNQFVPSWLMKVAQGPTDQKTFNSSVAAVMRTLASSGDYDLTKKDDLSRLASDAKRDARLLYIIRGASQFVSPGAPTADYQVYDKQGHLAEMQVLMDRYNQHKQKDGPDQAFSWLIDNLGTKNIFLAQAASSPNSYAAPTTKTAQDWADAHPDVVKKYPLTYGLFAPTSQDRKFSIDAYNQQFDRGERRSLSAEEQIAQAENRLGFFMYDRKRAEILKGNQGQNLDEGQQTWLRSYREYLQQEFPGFDSYLASPYDSQKRRTSAIGELQSAVKDEQVAGTDAGQGLKAYLEYRTEAFQSAKSGGLASPFQAKKAAPLRDWLRQAADYIVSQHPDFRPMWEQIFSHEFTTEAK